MPKTNNRSKGKERVNFSENDVEAASQKEESALVKETEGFLLTTSDKEPLDLTSEEQEDLVHPDPVPPIAHLFLGGALLTLGMVSTFYGANEIFTALAL